MLQFLRIRNLALIESVELEIGGGFTAVTGETGAGKSILLGALSLLAGARADKSVIRQGADACEVEAALHFPDASPVHATLDRLGLPACEEGMLILKRTLAREKAPRISINGGLATLSALEELGALWIDFHGPSEPRRLLKEACQLELLDLYAGHEPLGEAHAEAFDAWRTAARDLDALAGETSLPADEIDHLRKQVAAIDALELSEESIGELELKFTRLSSAQELLTTARGIAEGLTGDDGLLGRLAALVRAGQHLEQLDAGSKALAARLAALAVELEDTGAEFDRLAEEFQFDPEEAAEVERKMESWLDVRRRHGNTVAAVLEARERLARKLATQGNVKEAIAKQQALVASTHAAARKTAAALRKSRESAARGLSKEGAKRIAGLGFARTEFSVKLADATELRASGDCTCEFLFSPNVGEPAMPLSRIASSGELARVMLALKTILAAVDKIPVLVFDEVDSNVGGEIGRVVGERLAEIATKHQVLCVTHLPQVAAHASTHLVVEKDQSGKRAEVSIRAIEGSRKIRVEELARMLGDRAAKSALKHAEELLSQAGV
ncbi:MAG TPA: DNA repair protein RecN [Opitutaceae bacterium]|nr:DNA repair protein RecN [Opitutaceae bacterium]